MQKTVSFLDATVQDLPDRKKENLTSIWFTENWSKVVPMLTELLGNKFKKSRESDMIQDMVMDFVLKYIKKDGFRPVFEQGKTPTMGSVRMFAIRTTIDSLRKAGRDYSCRMNYGSKTSLEYRKDTQFSMDVIEDRFFDNIEDRVYINERIEILKKRITYGVSECRHKNLVSILFEMVKGLNDSELKEKYNETDIKRVKRFIRKDPKELKI